VSDPWGLSPGDNGDVLVANAAGANVLALRDKNHDGDALDIGEIVTFADGISAPVDIVALPAELPGDFNQDGAVDTADFVAWSKGLVPSTPENYNIWRTNFGETVGTGSSSAFPLPPSTLDSAAPEPTSLVTLLCGLLIPWRRNFAADKV
jgi:hypothetical protein